MGAERKTDLTADFADNCGSLAKELFRDIQGREEPDLVFGSQAEHAALHTGGDHFTCRPDGFQAEHQAQAGYGFDPRACFEQAPEQIALGPDFLQEIIRQPVYHGQRGRGGNRVSPEGGTVGAIGKDILHLSESRAAPIGKPPARPLAVETTSGWSP